MQPASNLTPLNQRPSCFKRIITTLEFTLLALKKSRVSVLQGNDGRVKNSINVIVNQLCCGNVVAWQTKRYIV
ncbi:hypothetical protein Lbru_1630 [Legionella brunensis]|uniref:Uncharacterized protein n=1 Tax=Legionella brunensis TaxID=29422 RepID=A0A0W0SKB3_9GAMM|nr:hypothetical protein Lbru_1630 [Legionella brunensis]